MKLKKTKSKLKKAPGYDLITGKTMKYYQRIELLNVFI